LVSGGSMGGGSEGGDRPPPDGCSQLGKTCYQMQFWGFKPHKSTAPDPTGGAYSTPPDPQAGGEVGWLPRPQEPHPPLRPFGPRRPHRPLAKVSGSVPVCDVPYLQ